MKRLIRDVGEEEVTRLLKQIMENDMMLFKFTKTNIGVASSRRSKKEEVARKRTKEERKQEKVEEEGQKRRKEKEKEKKRKRIDNE